MVVAGGALGTSPPLHALAGGAGPASCADVKAADPSATDGSYQIVVSRVTLTVYCADMATAPLEYISLAQTGPGENFSQYTAGGASPGSDVATAYTKLRVDPTPVSTDPLRFAVNIADQRFSSSTGSLQHAGSVAVTSMPYGVAMSCIAPDDAAGIANLDLTGTPFEVVNTFTVGGFASTGSTSASAQVVNLTGGGFCGWNAPAPLFNPFNTDAGYDLQLQWIDDDLALSNVPADISTDATSPDGALVTYATPSVTDEDLPATAAVGCAPVSASTFAIGTTTVTCTAGDSDDVTEAVATFNVHVKGAAEQLADLQGAVQSVGPGSSLSDKVSEAEAELASGDVADACGTLAAFINEVQAQTGQSIPGAQAAALVAADQQIQAVLAC